MKKLLLISMLVVVFSLVASGAALADDNDDVGSGTFTFQKLAEPPYLYVHEIDGMFKGTLLQGPDVNGVSIAVCLCKVRPSEGKNGYVGKPGDQFTITLYNNGDVGAGVGTYVLSDGTGKLAGIEGAGSWTYDSASFTGTYQGVTEIDVD